MTDATEIAFINGADAQDAVDFAFTVEAMRIQFSRDFLPHWSGFLPIPRQLVVTGYDSATNLAPGSFWPIEVVADLNDPSILGDHGGFEATGTAWGRSLPRSHTESHELLEMAGDPFSNRWVRLPSGTVVALEVADPVQSDSYWINATVAGQTRRIEVSNFVLPAWFGEGRGQLDFLNKCSLAGENRGYVIVQGPDGTTSNVFASTSIEAQRAEIVAKQENPLTRVARRLARPPTEHWLLTHYELTARRW